VIDIGITNYTVTTALGEGRAANRYRLLRSETGLRRGLEDPGFGAANSIDTFTGVVPGLERVVLPRACAAYDCRNNRLALLALEQDGFRASVNAARSRYGVARVGVMLGTSTSGIRQTERAYREARRVGPDGDTFGPLPDWYHYKETQNTHSVTEFVAASLGVVGPAFTVSTACSSSARVFASAARFLTAGVVDAMVVGGVDSLCLTTLFGFGSLQLTAPDICRPCDAHRQGISIGEGGGFALLERAGIADARARFLGYGESADAYHMSTPHPDGLGAALAMADALRSAGVPASMIDYVNLHGTGTRANDTTETKAVVDVLGRDVPCSSTKGFTGHTLGACGIVEVALSLLAMEAQVLPANLNLQTLDDAIEANVVPAPVSTRVDRVVTNSFGFGGNNCSLVLGRAA